MSVPAPRTLAALGLRRWRLRGSAQAARLLPAAPLPAAPAAPEAPEAPVGAAPGAAPAGSPAGLQVHVPGSLAAPAGGPEAAIWRQLMDWLALPAGAVVFQAAPGPGVVQLPAAAAWTSAAGKQAMWLALKSRAGARAGG